MTDKECNILFSNNLKHYMSEMDMSQTELAEKMDVSGATVNYWYNAVKIPRMDKVSKLAEILHCEVSDLLEDHDAEYYIDSRTASVAQAIAENEDLRILFDAAKNASPEELQLAAKMIETFKNMRGNS